MQIRMVGQRGQIVVPKRIRESLGLKPGKRVTFEMRGKTVILKPEEDPEKFVEEFVSVPHKMTEISVKKIKRILEEEYEIHRL